MLKNSCKKQKIDPKIVAAITATLTAGGYLNSNSRMVDIKKIRQMDSWKLSGVIEIMMGRDFSLG